MTWMLALALLLLRLVGGLTLAAHGTQKLLGWFGGPGMEQWTQGLSAQGYKPAPLWAWLVVVAEVGGGLSLALGFLTPLGAAGAFGDMLMAIITIHWAHGFFNSKGGFEHPLSLLVIAAALGIGGPGPASLDTLFNISWPYPWLFVILAIVAVVVDIVGVRMRQQQAASGAPAPQRQA